ncbi:MAG: hypothetical protein GY754_09440 [bacterium]|nr:hypothetical protein [bacterium]
MRKTKKTIYFLTALLLWMVLSIPLLANDLQVSLRLDKRTYHANERIIVQMYVSNISNKKTLFLIYDKRNNKIKNYTTFQPVVFDMQGREAETIVPYRLTGKSKNALIKKLNKRIMVLAPGETMIHSIDLKKLYRLSTNTRYRIKGFFWPDFAQETSLEGENEITFKVIRDRKDIKKSGSKEIVRGLSPSEVIHLALTAEKNRDWARVIKYIKIEEYIKSYPDFKKRYVEADIVEKNRIEQKFIKFLARERYDYLLDFWSIKEDPVDNSTIANVEVIVDRFGVRKTDRYKYRYTLKKYKKYRNLWFITGFEATVLKGKKL